ncbi:hypothetical protein CEXT_78581 [Caerostris extrusa]|uniref:Uncharacterized protein n=1 Tax=Caerostris extrusa TaxID=172846 RepID=A0AAV4MAD3_CAEEX|nr:hypothetical protein CEXT_78581 [Caerostris extrusa]
MTYCDQERRSFIKKRTFMYLCTDSIILRHISKGSVLLQGFSFQKFLGREEKNTWKSFYGSQASSVLEETEYTLKHTRNSLRNSPLIF